MLSQYSHPQTEWSSLILGVWGRPTTLDVAAYAVADALASAPAGPAGLAGTNLAAGILSSGAGLGTRGSSGPKSRRAPQFSIVSVCWSGWAPVAAVAMRMIFEQASCSFIPPQGRPWDGSSFQMQFPRAQVCVANAITHGPTNHDSAARVRETWTTANLPPEAGPPAPRPFSCRLAARLK